MPTSKPAWLTLTCLVIMAGSLGAGVRSIPIQGHNGRVCSVASSPNGTLLASRNADRPRKKHHKRDALIFLSIVGAFGALAIFIKVVAIRQTRLFRKALSVLPVQKPTLSEILDDEELTAAFFQDSCIPNELRDRLPPTYRLDQFFGLIRCKATEGEISALYWSIRGAGYDFNGDYSLVTRGTRLIDFLKEFSPHEYHGE